MVMVVILTVTMLLLVDDGAYHVYHLHKVY